MVVPVASWCAARFIRSEARRWDRGGRLAGRPDAEDDADGDAEADGDGDRAGLERRRPRRRRRRWRRWPASPKTTPTRPPTRLSVTDSTRNWARMSRLARPDRLADADLARPLADRHEHDVHDPDAADDERDRGDAGQHERERAAHRGGRLQQLRLVEDLEVVVVRDGQAVQLAQQRRDGCPWPSSMPSAEAALTAMVRTASEPEKYFCSVVTGMRTWSSGSWKPEPPFSWRMPHDGKGSAADLDLLADARRRRGPGRRRSWHPSTATRSALVDGEVGQAGALPELEAAHRRDSRRSCPAIGRRRVGVADDDELRGGDLRRDAGEHGEAVEGLGVRRASGSRPSRRPERAALSARTRG